MEIPIPNIKFQNKIVLDLDLYFQYIDTNNKIIDEYDKL